MFVKNRFSRWSSLPRFDAKFATACTVNYGSLQAQSVGANDNDSTTRCPRVNSKKYLSVGQRK
ncbi:hypothetical protein JMJ77_0010164, partial [Colletotrichum scovillei]